MKKISVFLFLLIFGFLVWGQVFAPELTADEIKSYDENSTHIVIKTNVPKVSVFLNNVFQGLSLLDLKDLREGMYFLHLEKDGFDPKDFTFSISNGEAKTFFVEMNPCE